MPFFSTEDGEARPARIATVIGIPVVIVLGLLFFWPFTSIDATQRAVVTLFGKVEGNVLQPGLHTINPFASINRVTVATKAISFDNQSKSGDSSETSSLFAATKDLQDVQIAVATTYHIPESSVIEVYQQYQGENNFQTNKLSPIIRESVKSVSAQYTAEELVTKRSEVSDKMSSLISQKFTEVGASFETFKIVNFEFSGDFTKAIERKATAVQDAETAKNKLVQVQFEAQQQVESAKAQAETIRIQAQAINSQGGADYVQLQAIKAWDGHLPTQMIPGSAVPFINVGK